MNYGENDESHRVFGNGHEIDITTGKMENTSVIAVVIIVNIYLFSNMIIKNSTKEVTESAYNIWIISNAVMLYATYGNTPQKCKLTAKINDDTVLITTPKMNKQSQNLMSETFMRFNNQQYLNLYKTRPSNTDANA